MDIMTLNETYLDRTRLCDQSARRWKQVYQIVWFTISGLTGLVLVLAILGPDLEGHEGLAKFILHGVFPLCGLVVSGLTIFQVLVAPQHRWLLHRTAVQGLWNLAMLYRARMKPYQGDKAEDTLSAKLEERSGWLAPGHRPSWPQAIWKAIQEYSLPAAPKRADNPLVSQGLVPPLRGIDEYLDGRLRDQIGWYLGKARRCRTLYFVSQGLITGLSLFYSVYVDLYGRSFPMVGLLTAVTLGLVAWRDFLDCLPQYFAYRQTALDLMAIEKRHTAPIPVVADQPAPNATARLEALVEEVEGVLVTEYRFWYAIQAHARPREA